MSKAHIVLIAMLVAAITTTVYIVAFPTDPAGAFDEAREAGYVVCVQSDAFPGIHVVGITHRGYFDLPISQQADILRGAYRATFGLEDGRVMRLRSEWVPGERQYTVQDGKIVWLL